MYTLCSEVKAIVFDIASLNSFYKDQRFHSLLDQLSEKYRVYIFGSCPGFEYENDKIGTGLDFDFNKDENIYEFLDTGGEEQYLTIVITNNQQTIKKVSRFNFSSIALVHSNDELNQYDIRYMPDQVWNLKIMEDILLSGEGYSLAYFEMIGLNNSKQNKLYFFKEYSNLLIHAIDEHTKVDLIYTGRYFRYNDPRAYAHRLTQLLLNLKKEKQYAINALGNSLNKILGDIQKSENGFDWITIVPARPGQQNRLISVLNKQINEEYFSKYKLDLLYCKRDYDSQKRMSTYVEKARNVYDVFGYLNEVHGHILLIDDIFTSGATTLECARMLYKAGASKVTVLPFAVTQSSSTEMGKLPLIKEGNQEYKLRFNTKDSHAFWGIGIEYSEEYDTIRNKYLKNNNFDNYTYR